jgi:hypothetical protein
LIAVTGEEKGGLAEKTLASNQYKFEVEADVTIMHTF